jgi:hypothetical protein
VSTVRGTNSWRHEAWGKPDYPTRGNVPLARVQLDPDVPIVVHAAAVEAFVALAQVFARYRYDLRPADTGAYNPRAITGGTSPSPHAWGIALDSNWQTNPYSKRLIEDYPEGLPEAIKAIRTKGGWQVFQWGGDWRSVKDAMHWELFCTRAELAVGIDWRTVDNGVPGPQPIHTEDDMRIAWDSAGRAWLITGGVRVHIPEMNDHEALRRSGITDIGRVTDRFLDAIPVARAA